MTKQKTSPNQLPTILDPINIARARHAASKQTTTASHQITKTAKPSPKKPSTTLPQATNQAKNNSAQNSINVMIGDTNGCVFLVVVGFVFLMGSILGGVVGGGIALFATNPDEIAFLSVSPTPMPQPTSTPAPAATLTPTPTTMPQVAPPIEKVILDVTKSVVTVINKHDEDLYESDDGRVVGSGVIIDERGYIATNNHVVKNPGQLSIVLSDGREIPAQLIASKADQDLAVLKISLINLPIISWADSTKVLPGQTVYAVGSPLGDFPNSVS
ncbi:trypsin-like peptidase domain-containing protein, partial [Anaerolineales bacterium HSG24]|nr:trypsin-like peptidase domain-containing protein [Anaerolineales bacterium HSG24]